MAQISVELKKKKYFELESVLEVVLPEFVEKKEEAVEKLSIGKKLSKLINLANAKELRRIEVVKSMQNFRQYAIF
ncbi:MAG: hypothetical protein ACTSV5_01825 [Promethearchaeota archaeon]